VWYCERSNRCFLYRASRSGLDNVGVGPDVPAGPAQAQLLPVAIDLGLEVAERFALVKAKAQPSMLALEVTVVPYELVYMFHDLGVFHGKVIPT